MDIISDMIIRLKNAARAGRFTVSIPYSAFRFAIAEKLKERGFLSRVEKESKKAKYSFEVEIACDAAGAPRIEDVARISRPGARRYSGVGSLRAVKSGRGALLVSTSKGVLTSDEAKKAGVGGEALFEIW